MSRDSTEFGVTRRVFARCVATQFAVAAWLEPSADDAVAQEVSVEDSINGLAGGWLRTVEMDAPEAFQAAAADDRFVFAISSRSVAKYDRVTKRKVAVSLGDAEHLNSGFLWKDMLLCAHSNYPQKPERSEVYTLNPETMRLSIFHRFDRPPGSLTWVVRHQGQWWCNFAHYGIHNAKTKLVSYDDSWNPTGQWSYPKSLVADLGLFSLSGGVWIGDELCVTGHDKPVLYRLRLPRSGEVLEYVGRQSIPFSGQGIARDPVTMGLVGIHRTQRKVIFAERKGDESVLGFQMPSRGICAHRGASDSHPENTLAAFREAIRLGVAMIEFDVALSKDSKLVLMHDQRIDRTTDGTGRVGDLTLADLKRLDAGSWKHSRFRGERIPTLAEALAMMPKDVWLNVHLKGSNRLAALVTEEIVKQRRQHQAFLACGASAAAAAKRVHSSIMICNMDRQANSLDYANQTIEHEANFIQLLGGTSVATDVTRRLRDHGVRINYCCVNDAEKLRTLFRSGVEFPLVDCVSAMMEVADEIGIPRRGSTH